MLELLLQVYIIRYYLHLVENCSVALSQVSRVQGSYRQLEDQKILKNFTYKVPFDKRNQQSNYSYQN
ncbi:unnamed protein product [Paramecium octaurelia]|nr:unnamed protein product [Paramecium octaurelia]